MAEVKDKDAALKNLSDFEATVSEVFHDFRFYKREPHTLDVLSCQLSVAILPFILYLEKKIIGKDFEKFRSNATTNPNIFKDFARYICKSYLFKYIKSKL